MTSLKIGSFDSNPDKTPELFRRSGQVEVMGYVMKSTHHSFARKFALPGPYSPSCSLGNNFQSLHTKEQNVTILEQELQLLHINHMANRLVYVIFLKNKQFVERVINFHDLLRLKKTIQHISTSLESTTMFRMFVLTFLWRSLSTKGSASSRILK